MSFSEAIGYDSFGFGATPHPLGSQEHCIHDIVLIALDERQPLAALNPPSVLRNTVNHMRRGSFIYDGDLRKDYSLWRILDVMWKLESYRTRWNAPNPGRRHVYFLKETFLIEVAIFQDPLNFKGQTVVTCLLFWILELQYCSLQNVPAWLFLSSVFVQSSVVGFSGSCKKMVIIAVLSCCIWRLVCPLFKSQTPKAFLALRLSFSLCIQIHACTCTHMHVQVQKYPCKYPHSNSLSPAKITAGLPNRV